MRGRQVHTTKGPEAIIQQAVIKELRYLNWYVKSTHGDAYQAGFPDLFCCHMRYGHRWVECKNPLAYRFTNAQLENFPVMQAHGSNIWVATTHEGIQELLMGPPNWYQFLGVIANGH